MERPWMGNLPNLSCIPDGTYGLREHASPKYGDTYALINHEHGVGIYPGDSRRSLILIHAANRPSELQGCIAPGMGMSVFGNEWGVSFSRAALKKIMKTAERESILTLKAATATWVAPEV